MADTAWLVGQLAAEATFGNVVMHGPVCDSCGLLDQGANL
jgi:hypothetical protein